MISLQVKKKKISAVHMYESESQKVSPRMASRFYWTLSCKFLFYGLDKQNRESGIVSLFLSLLFFTCHVNLIYFQFLHSFLLFSFHLHLHFLSLKIFPVISLLLYFIFSRSDFIKQISFSGNIIGINHPILGNFSGYFLFILWT